MLSPRVWLERFPRQLRFLVAFLAMLSFVAPTWHVCSLGGHVTEMSHHDGAMKHEVFPVSKSGAVICFCPPKHRDEKFPVDSRFGVRSNMTHDASCLALLLGSMPALLASPLEEMSVWRISFPLWFPTQRDEPTRERIRTFSSRGPPR